MSAFESTLPVSFVFFYFWDGPVGRVEVHCHRTNKTNVKIEAIQQSLCSDYRVLGIQNHMRIDELPALMVVEERVFYTLFF